MENCWDIWMLVKCSSTQQIDGIVKGKLIYRNVWCFVRWEEHWTNISESLKSSEQYESQNVVKLTEEDKNQQQQQQQQNNKKKQTIDCKRESNKMNRNTISIK